MALIHVTIAFEIEFILGFCHDPFAVVKINTELWSGEGHVSRHLLIVTTRIKLNSLRGFWFHVGPVSMTKLDNTIYHVHGERKKM